VNVCNHTLHRSLVSGQWIVHYASLGPHLPSLVLLFFLPVLELGKLQNAVRTGEVGQVQLVLPGELKWDEATAEEVMPALEVAGASLRGGERNEEVRLETTWVTFFHIPTCGGQIITIGISRLIELCKSTQESIQWHQNKLFYIEGKTKDT